MNEDTMRKKKDIAYTTKLGQGIEVPKEGFWTQLHNWAARAERLILENLERGGVGERIGDVQAKVKHYECELHVELVVSVSLPERLAIRSYHLVTTGDDLAHQIALINREARRLLDRLTIAAKALRSADIREAETR